MDLPRWPGTSPRSGAHSPDQRLQVAEVLADGDRVAVWMRLSGTHRGTFRGHAATGRRAEWDEVAFFEVRDGLIVRGL